MDLQGILFNFTIKTNYMKPTIKIQRILSTSVLALVLSLALTSCTDRYDEMNTPQDQIVVSKIDANLMGQSFAYAQYNSVSGLSTYIWNTALYPDRFAQY